MTGSSAVMGVDRKRLDAKTSARASSASFSLGGESERSSAKSEAGRGGASVGGSADEDKGERKGTGTDPRLAGGSEGGRRRRQLGSLAREECGLTDLERGLWLGVGSHRVRTGRRGGGVGVKDSSSGLKLPGQKGEGGRTQRATARGRAEIF